MRIVLFSLCSLIMFKISAFASYAENENALELVHQLAQRENFDEAYLQSLLLAISYDDAIIKKMTTPAEKTLSWKEYRAIFLDEARIANGVIFWKQNQALLQRAAAEFGVDESIIVAILGVETRYGKVVGNTPVLQALATLCFDYPARAKFFCEQFGDFLILARKQDFNPLRLQGSYAGAMGMAQFMPSSYLNDAIDFDSDNKIDLWKSNADAIGSVANYLANRDWQRGGKLVFELPSAPKSSNFASSYKPHFDCSQLLEDENLKNDNNVMNWAKNCGAEKVGAIVFTGEDFEKWWITHHNFAVITRYNSSPMYAMAVVELAAAMAAQMAL